MRWFHRRMRPRQNGRHFADEDIFGFCFALERYYISMQISLQQIPRAQSTKKDAMVHVMAWCQIGDNNDLNQCCPDLLTHLSVFRSGGVDTYWISRNHWLILGLIADTITKRITKWSCNGLNGLITTKWINQNCHTCQSRILLVSIWLMLAGYTFAIYWDQIIWSMAVHIKFRKTTTCVPGYQY